MANVQQKDNCMTLLDNMGLTDRADYVSHASTPQQSVHPLADAPETAPYFSMILVYKGAENWVAALPVKASEAAGVCQEQEG